MFLRTQKIFDSLSHIGSSANRDLFSGRLSELAPILRYCEYNLKKQEGKNADALLRMITSSGKCGRRTGLVDAM